MNERGLPLRADPSLDVGGLYQSAEIQPTVAEKTVERLLSFPTSDAAIRVLNCSTLANKTTLDVILARSRSRMSTDLPRAMEIARLGRLLATRTLPRTVAAPVAADCQILALVQIANVARRLFRSKRAGKALAAAEQRLDDYTGNPQVAATYLISKALYLADAKRSGESLALLEDALVLFEALGDSHCFGKALLDQATILFNSDRPQEAIQKAQRARSYLDIAHQPRWGFVLLQRLALFHTATGEVELAHDYLNDALAIPHYTVPTHERLQILRTRARLFALKGRLKEALALSIEVREAFLAEGLPYEAALSSLDFALELARSGRWTSLAGLAEEFVTSFRTAGLPAEALAALERLKTARSVEAIQAIIATVRRLKARRPIRPAA